MPYRYYMLPLGIWQWWAIFAPDPVQGEQAAGSRGRRRQGNSPIYEFPKIGDLSWWARIPRYRHPKFTEQHDGP